jgi:purine-nucleoside phosphorylase
MIVPNLPQELTDFKPEIGLILGSGLGFFADDRIEVLGRLPYGDIEGFPVSTVQGHVGQFVYGTIEGKRVICMQGRFHFYEGYTMSQVTLPIRAMHQMGVHTLFVTNAAGGINLDYLPGNFMLLSDHINGLGTNPLIAWKGTEGVQFPDMTEVYNGELLATTGPSFETPAEVRAFGILGADAVGMSTVPEAIVARKFGMRVIGISCITNAAAGISKSELSHEEVSETADSVRPQFADLLAAGVKLA